MTFFRDAKRLYAILAALTLAALPSVGPAESAYEIHAVLPVTGTGAFLGRGSLEAIAAIEGYVNKSGGVKGHPIKFVVHDDQSNPQQAVQITNALVAQNVPIIYGSELAAVCGAMAPLVKAGPAVYCMSAGFHPAAGGYVFGAGQSSEDQVGMAIRYAHLRGWDKVAVLTSTDATGQDADRMIDSSVTAADNAGMTIVDREHFAPSDVTVAAQLARIRNAGGQALIAWTTGTPLGTVLRGIRDSALDLPILAGSGNVTLAQMKQYSALLPKDLFFPAVPSLVPAQLPAGAIRNAAIQMQDAFKAINVRPDISHAMLWDPAMIIISALRKYGTGMSAAQLRDYVSGLQWTGSIGRYDFRAVPQRGIGINYMLVVRWDAAKDNFVAASKLGGAPIP